MSRAASGRPFFGSPGPGAPVSRHEVFVHEADAFNAPWRSSSGPPWRESRTSEPHGSLQAAERKLGKPLPGCVGSSTPRPRAAQNLSRPPNRAPGIPGDCAVLARSTSSAPPGTRRQAGRSLEARTAPHQNPGWGGEVAGAKGIGLEGSLRSSRMAWADYGASAVIPRSRSGQRDQRACSPSRGCAALARPPLVQGTGNRWSPSKVCSAPAPNQAPGTRR